MSNQPNVSKSEEKDLSEEERSLCDGTEGFPPVCRSSRRPKAQKFHRCPDINNGGNFSVAVKLHIFSNSIAFLFIMCVF